MPHPPPPWTSPPPGARSWADWIAWPPPRRQAFLNQISPQTLASLPHLFEFWAGAHQRPPPGDWSTWVALGGRGAGKTRAGAEWIRAQMEGSTPLAPGRCRRAALVGETLDQAREVMAFGESGLIAVAPPDRRPAWHAGRRALIWPNGAEAALFSASDPETLRGPQFDAAWCDELGKWRKAREAWDMLQFALRLGDHPRALATTTPRDNAVLREILAAPGTVVTRAPTEANAPWLAPGFIDRLRARYGHGPLARQEIDGAFIDSAPGALWTAALLESLRCAPDAVPPLDRIVVAVDPPAGGRDADACGIIVAGVVNAPDPASDLGQSRAWVLADRSVQGLSPAGWAAAAARAYADFAADRLIAEVNQGGDMVEAVVRQCAPNIAFRPVRAVRGKGARAEPVAALYEQGRVRHAGGFPELEDQLRGFAPGGFQGSGSPDRADALVWALTELLLSDRPSPRMRGL